MLPAAAPDLWRWQPHPEVWLLVGGLFVAWRYALRAIGPRAVLPDEPVSTRGQRAWMATALVVLWLSSDWPVHDLAEEHLYSVHMSQHLLLTLVFPPLVLLGTPTWLARLVVGSGRAYAVLRWLTRLIPATLLFNAYVILSHWPVIVDAAVASAPVHYGIHVVAVATAMLVWIPVCGPLPELRFSLPVQMAHLFLQSIVPTVPAGWLIFADRVVYDVYGYAGRIWGLTSVEDQQVAAAIMKIVGGTYLWLVIGVLFFRFAARHEAEANDRDRGTSLDRRAPTGEPSLTFDDVARAFETAGPPPREP